MSDVIGTVRWHRKDRYFHLGILRQRCEIFVMNAFGRRSIWSKKIATFTLDGTFIRIGTSACHITR